MAPPVRIDWARVEPDWRAGVKSVLQIKADYEESTGRTISHAAINKHFKKLGIPRDLTSKVRDKARAIVSTSIVSAMVSPETTITDMQIIDANANVVASVLLSERKDIGRSRALVASLLEELEQTTINRELFESLGSLLKNADERGMDKLNELYVKITSMASRIDGVKKLSEALRVLVALERQAFNIDAVDSEKDPLTQILEHVAANRRSLVGDDD